MAYLYGDSTPFPLNENYIDTIRDAVELCTTLLQIDRTLEQLRQQTRDERESTDSTLAEFKKLASEMDGDNLDHMLDQLDDVDGVDIQRDGDHGKVKVKVTDKNGN